MPKPAVTEPFSLAGMGDMLRETNADLASKVGVDEVEPPKTEPSPDPADDTQDPENGEGKPEGESTPAASDGGGAPSEEELAAEQKKQQEEAAAAADKKKKDDEAAAAQKAKDDEAARKAAESAAPAAGQKTPEQEAREKRDSDLNPELSPHTHPKTRQLITSFKTKTQAARDERDTIARERDSLKQQVTELAEKAKGVALPKEVDEELKTLRERVRELDIAKDPAIEAKYDKPIAANNKAVVDLLKSFGADQVVDPKNAEKTIPDPRFEANLLRSGLTLKTLQPLIEKLEKAGFVDEAEQLRESIRENARLSRSKQQEIDAWKTDYDQRIKTRTQQTQQAAEQENKVFAAEAETALKSDLAELTKTLPFLTQPPAPLPTDSEPVRKAKQAALDEYNAAAQAVEKAVAGFNPAGLPADKARSAAARLNANAVQGVIFKLHVVPRLQREIATRDSRIKELETQLAKLKNAGSLSRQHATLAAPPPGAAPEIPAGAATQDAMAAFAKAQGVNIDS